MDHLAEERSLRRKLIEEMRDILRAILRKGFVIPRTAAEGDDHGFSSLALGGGSQGSGAEYRGGCSHAGECTKEGAAGGRYRFGDLPRSGRL